MFAAYAARIDPDQPLSALELGERPEPEARPGWTTVNVKAASLNRHDLWSLTGAALGPVPLSGVEVTEEQLPMILGSDAAGIDEDGNEVVLHNVIGQTGYGLGPDETPAMLSKQHYQGTFAERVRVPLWNVVPKPKELSFEEAACLPTAWLTAYQMLFTKAGVRPGQSVLVQGTGGGVATAAIVLAAAAGLRVFATSRDKAKLKRARELGAEGAFETGTRLPHQVDAVIDSVGAATWSHSLTSLKPGGTLVICGTTSGTNPTEAELHRIFFYELKVAGSTGGTKEELADLLNFCAATGVRPVIDSVLPLDRAREAFEKMAKGGMFGKLVLTV
ncbi:zinc-binding dehydrogenase [Streptomyces klenkii]|uniref:Zn-dependent oxidoreductase n=1 Tax=Streptomyces klenkii TaxID=1420899 RepID=A0A3B0C2W6_9ACTN|nr:zinc-binding dehydrogenase [Streptomyces klenkii]RKN77626.1 Zn-dependent oxidoreductase [Streptomyces klenkii]